MRSFFHYKVLKYNIQSSIHILTIADCVVLFKHGIFRLVGMLWYVRFFSDENYFVFYLCLYYGVVACIADIDVPLIKC